MLSAFIKSVALRGYGLPGWLVASQILQKNTPLNYNEIGEMSFPAGMSSRERRRLSPSVKLALSVAEEAIRDSELDPKTIASLFSWPHGDTGIIQSILEELSSVERYVSPTEFHNSVHNVAVGYWSIATGCQMPSTSISAGIDTFSAALTKALSMIRASQFPVLLTLLDAPFPEPLNSVCTISGEFAIALVILPHHVDNCLARIDVNFSEMKSDNYTVPTHDDLKNLWDSNAVIRSIPLMENLACQKDGTVSLPYGAGSSLEITITNYNL